ncbi:hypothetical protein ACF1AE_20975 [Streptomyces sp. NPDC014986]|uniref:hypothetical protein n=1 Tax=Streptomyces sp. NPDC014986 TaxID=3364934 RepID=UPI003700073B
MEGATQPQGPAYPDVTVQLSEEDSNAYHIVGQVCRALRQAGHPEAASEFAATAFQLASHDELLQLTMRTVDVH